MGVSLNWKPVKPDNSVCFGTGSSLFKALTEAFGELPIELDQRHVERLKGIRSCGFDDVDDLIDAINTHELIEIDGQW